MTKTPAWRRYLRFWHANVAADVDDELRFHREMRVAEFMARGMSEDEARGAVAERLGDVASARAECIELGRVRETHARNADFLDGLSADVRYALRSLGRAPGWTAVALLTIALGVGATTAVFHVADALLVRPMPYPNASRVLVYRRLFSAENRQLNAPFSPSVLTAWRSDARSIEAAGAFHAMRDFMTLGADSVPVNIASVDAGFLALAGARPLLGRTFTAAETVPDGPHVIILGEDFWRYHFGASPDVLGKTVSLGGQSSTIIGVIPATLTLPEFYSGRSDVWAPYQADLVQAVAVRLRPGVPREAASEELTAILERVQVDEPWWRDMHLRNGLVRPQELLGFRNALAMLTGAVALLLLVACTNVAHLLLARGASRQRELAVRHALGAGRPRLVRQLVTETLVLAVLGGVLAVMVASAGLHLLQRMRPESLVGPLAYVRTDRGIVSMTAVLAIAAGLAIGIATALRSARRDAALALRSGMSSTPLGGRRARGALVVGEIALSATLLVGALLLVHALYDIESKQLGFDAGGLFSISFRPGRSLAEWQPAPLIEVLRARAPSIPGQLRSTVSTSLGAAFSSFETTERPAPADAVPVPTAFDAVSPDYFAVMGMPLLAGRMFDPGASARHETIVNTTLARLIWPNENPLGRSFRNARPIAALKDWMTVIGVVPDVVDNLLASAPQPRVYLPMDPAMTTRLGIVTFSVRLRDDVPASSLLHFAASVQPSGSKPLIESVKEKIDRSAAEPRFAMRLMIVFALLGVVLAAIGLYGVIAYSVGQRTREIGVRMTLGATRGSIAKLVVGDGIRLALIGIAVGLAGATAATRLIQSSLYGVSQFDPFSFAVGAVVLLAVAVVACVVPMWRATGVDPVIAVRAD
jgi:putative ABC transport system permease protein